MGKGSVWNTLADKYYGTSEPSTNRSPLEGVGAKISAAWKNTQGKKHASHTAEKDAEEAKVVEEDAYNKNKAAADVLQSSGSDYLGRTQSNTDKYQGDLDRLRGETEAAQIDAGHTYTNDIQPRMKTLMEDAQKNSADAMTLKDAMDPNNKVAAGTRALYDAQGNKVRDSYNAEADRTRQAYNDQGAGIQKQYETEAQGEGKQGLADAGVLGALGMQNMAGQLGGVPMTGGQLQALMGANQAQTGASYAKTQQRLQSLRDQGLTGNITEQNLGLNNATSQRNEGLGRQADLGSQGLTQGFARSDIAYNQGRDAVKDYTGAVRGYEDASDRQLGRDKDFRGQRGGYASQSHTLQQQMADTTRQVGDADTQRRQAIENAHAGGKYADLSGDIARINGEQQANASQVTGGTQAVGTVAGAYFGGPAGAAAGSKAGQAAGQAAAPEDNPTPAHADYTQSGNGAQMGPPAYAAGGQTNTMPPEEGLGLTDTRAMPAQGYGPQFRNPYPAADRGAPSPGRRPSVQVTEQGFSPNQQNSFNMAGQSGQGANSQALARYQQRRGARR